jgi:hypothetical protein
LYGDYLIIIGNPLAPPTPAARTAPHAAAIREKSGAGRRADADRALANVSFFVGSD